VREVNDIMKNIVKLLELTFLFGLIKSGCDLESLLIYANRPDCSFFHTLQ
jgi:hypothetical protein